MARFVVGSTTLVYGAGKEAAPGDTINVDQATAERWEALGLGKVQEPEKPAPAAVKK